MILDGLEFPRGKKLTCDVVVIGSGAAGVTLALELGKAGKDVILLESGGKKIETRTQDLYKGEVADTDIHAPIDGDRYRVLGGTTTVWGGQCLPLDPIDFQKRDFVPHSGWPIGSADLDPYYHIAHKYVECGDFTYTVDKALPDEPKEFIPGLREGDVRSGTIDRYSIPTDFGKRYRSDLKQSPNIRLVLHANCVSINVTPNGDRVTGVEASSLNKNEFTVEAGTVVLAAGGLETTRLLLSSNEVHQQGIGNHSNWLGRCYMGHISGDISKLVINGDPSKVVFGYEFDRDGNYCRRRLCVSPDVQLKNKMMNIVVWLDTLPLYDPSHKQGVLSLAFFAKNLRSIQRRIPPEYSKILSMGTSTKEANRAHLKNILRDIPKILSYYPGFAYKRFIKKPMIPSLLSNSRTKLFGLHYHSEHEPNRESRVTLLDDRDELGMRRLYVNFQYTDNDVETVVKAHEIIDRELRESNVGYVQYYRPEQIREHIREQVASGSHQAGTTRMSKDPADGVVDQHCRVHGIPNLMVASSSTFPTSSQANPTLTIVAMAARMADFLSKQA